MIVAAPDDPAAVRTTVSGRYHYLVQIPVPARHQRPGEIIRQDAVEWTRIRDRRLGRNIVTELDQLIGLTPRRPLKARQPVRTSDLQAPIVVPKGSTVTVTLRRPRMILTTKGRAAENGARGELIRIINLKSNKTIEAVVSGPGRAVVVESPDVALN